MFLVPPATAFFLVQLSLCRKAEVLPAERARSVLRGCRVAVKSAARNGQFAGLPGIAVAAPFASGFAVESVLRTHAGRTVRT